MEKLIVILGISLLILGIILVVLMISIILMQRSGRFSNNAKFISNNINTTSTNNDELVAAITAAVSMYYIVDTGIVPLFRVKSIKKAYRR